MAYKFLTTTICVRYQISLSKQKGWSYQTSHDYMYILKVKNEQFVKIMLVITLHTMSQHHDAHY